MGCYKRYTRDGFDDVTGDGNVDQRGVYINFEINFEIISIYR